MSESGKGSLQRGFKTQAVRATSGYVDNHHTSNDLSSTVAPNRVVVVLSAPPPKHPKHSSICKSWKVGLMTVLQSVV